MRCELSRRRPSAAALAAVALLLSAAWAGPALAALLRSVPLRPCVFKSLSGLPCAACGTTRALLSLLEGAWGGAFLFQPLGTAAAACAAGAAVLLALLAAAGVRVRVGLSAGEKTALRFAAVYLVLVNWLYLVDTGI